MKSFYSNGVSAADSLDQAVIAGGIVGLPCARVAVYDTTAAAPRVEEVSASGVAEYIERLALKVYELARDMGGDIPYSVVREVSENFIHADFADPVVSVMDGGRLIRFADRGPGITDKNRAVLPGFTTACGSMKQFIRGVGSGLPLVVDFLTVSGGSIEIEDNLGTGSVVTISSGSASGATRPQRAGVRSDLSTSLGAHSSTASVQVSPEVEEHVMENTVAGPRLSTRQKQVLALVLESGSAGPSLVSKELGIGLSTAYRDLASLEDLALIEADGGKRRLTPAGMSYLSELMNR